jgi:hypothetical protein
MILVTPKTVAASDTISGYKVRGVFSAGDAWSPAALVRVVVTFFHGTRPVSRALVPAEILPTAAQIAVMQSVTRLPTDTAQAWVERASADFVQGAYGLTPAPAPTPTPARHRPPAPTLTPPARVT